MKTIIGMNEDRIWLIMDNSPVHCSGKVRNYLKERNCSWIFMLQYAPELAPVELFFGRLKRIISTRRTSSIINLDSKSGRIILNDVIASIDRLSIMKIFVTFCQSSNRSLMISVPFLKSIVRFIYSFYSSTLIK